MSYPLPTWPANSPSGPCPAWVYTAQRETYTCPCSCSGEFTRRDLAYHVLGLAESSVARHAARYTASGLEMSAVAVREVLDTYGDMLHLAINHQTPDWRNSDGLAGYAAQTVRYVSEGTP